MHWIHIYYHGLIFHWQFKVTCNVAFLIGFDSFTAYLLFTSNNNRELVQRSTHSSLYFVNICTTLKNVLKRTDLSEIRIACCAYYYCWFSHILRNLITASLTSCNVWSTWIKMNLAQLLLIQTIPNRISSKSTVVWEAKMDMDTHTSYSHYTFRSYTMHNVEKLYRKCV